MNLTVLFFASVKETLKSDRETLNNDSIETVSDLVHILSQRDNTWKMTLAEEKILVAVNQTISSFTTPLSPGDEIAFFPPVTGG